MDVCSVCAVCTDTRVLPSLTRTGTATLRGEDGGPGGTAAPNEDPVVGAVAELLLWMEELALV